MATKPATRAEKAAERSQTQSFTVLSKLDHDGEVYQPDDTVELTADQAKPLLDLQVVKPAPAGN